MQKKLIVVGALLCVLVVMIVVPPSPRGLSPEERSLAAESPIVRAPQLVEDSLAAPVRGIAEETGEQAAESQPAVPEQQKAVGEIAGSLSDISQRRLPRHLLIFQPARPPQPGDRPLVIHTDKRGEFHLKNVPVGRYHVCYRGKHAGIGPGTVISELEVWKDVITPCHVLLRGERKLSGTFVIETEGGGLKLELRNRWTGEIAATTYAVNLDPLGGEPPEERPPLDQREAREQPGFFELEAIPAGEYVLRVSLDAEVSGDVKIFKDEEIEVDLTKENLDLPYRKFAFTEFLAPGVRIREG